MPGTSRAFLWEDGVMTDLGVLPGTQQSSAEAINEKGQVVGNAYGGGFHAFLWEKGKMIDLGTLPGDVQSMATSINDRGQVIGSSIGGPPNSRPHAFIWEDGVMSSPPGTSNPDVFSAAYDINKHGQYVGSCGGPILWDKDSMLRLDLPATFFGINNQGVVVGYTATNRGILWERAPVTTLIRSPVTT